MISGEFSAIDHRDGAAAIRTMVAQPDAGHVRAQLDVIAGMLGRQLPKVEVMLRDAARDLLGGSITTAYFGIRAATDTAQSSITARRN